MRSALGRIAVLGGTLAVVAAGVVVAHVQASADPPRPEIIGHRDYSCSPDEPGESGFVGTIRVTFERPTRDTAGLPIAGVDYRIETGLEVGGDDADRANVTFTDTGADNESFETGDDGKQDGVFHPLGRRYVRDSDGGPVRFRFLFDRMDPGFDPQCSVRLPDIAPSGRALAVLGQARSGRLGYSCKDGGFRGTIWIHVAKPQPGTKDTVISKVRYEIDEGDNDGGDHANVTFNDDAPEAVPALDSGDDAQQDGSAHTLTSRRYTRSSGEVTFRFVFDKRHEEDPQCNVTLPDIP